MTANLIPLDPNRAAGLIARGEAMLVDIREPDEFARRHVKGALSRPLSAFEAAHLRLGAGKDVIFTCRSGMRTSANCERLRAAVDGEAYILEGGLDAWSAAGLPVEENREALEPLRRVQTAAGAG